MEYFFHVGLNKRFSDNFECIKPMKNFLNLFRIGNEIYLVSFIIAFMVESLGQRKGVPSSIHTTGVKIYAPFDKETKELNPETQIFMNLIKKKKTNVEKLQNLVLYIRTKKVLPEGIELKLEVF